ncbi:MAG: hypothetical protein HRU09_07230 [Oligoflexales bacterium]|nr:hypothetical protein [Oligoflexales bacterium]
MAFKEKLVFFVGCLMSALMEGGLAFGASLSFKGFVTDDEQHLRIRVTVEGTLDEIGEDDSTLSSRLEVTLLDSDSSPIIGDGGDVNTTDSGINNENYWENIEEPYTEPATTNRYHALYFIQVNNNTAGSAEGERTITDLLATHGVIRTRIRFTLVNGETVSNSDDQALTVLTTVPNEAPSDFEVTAVHRGGRVKWSGRNQVAHTLGPNQTEADTYQPQNVLVMVFPRTEADQLSIQGAQVNSQTGEHADIDCLFAYNEADPSSCISCPDNPADFFVKSSQTSELVEFDTASNDSSNASTVISGLEVGTEYIVVLQYERGAQRTACQSITPIETVSLTELNGEAEGVEGDPRCFIATAAFGSPFAQEVRLFRWFRDTFLLPFTWGERLVEFYYTHSPKLVESMSHSEALRSAIRFLLWPIAWALGFVQKLWEGEQEAIFFLLALGIVFFGLLLGFRYRFNFPSNS